MLPFFDQLTLSCFLEAKLKSFAGGVRICIDLYGFVRKCAEEVYATDRLSYPVGFGQIFEMFVSGNNFALICSSRGIYNSVK